METIIKILACIIENRKTIILIMELYFWATPAKSCATNSNAVGTMCTPQLALLLVHAVCLRSM